MNRKTLANGLISSGQIEITDLAKLARQGVTLVINNRPDGEKPGQPTAAEARQAATQAGIAYRHIPVTLATLRIDDVAAFADAVAAAAGPVHAHCASGHRSATPWALGQVRRGTMTEADAERRAYQNQVGLADGPAWLHRQST